MHKGPEFCQQDKAKEELSSDDKKDNGLQQNDSKNIRFKHKPNNVLDSLTVFQIANSLKKDTEIKGNETKIKSEKFAPNVNKNIGKKKK